MKYLSLILLSLNLFINAQESNWYPLGKDNNIIEHTYYTLSYSEDHEQAEWVQYTLKSDYLNSNISRTDNFRTDPLVRTTSAELIDYKGSGYDRGHLAPAADMKYNSSSMSESFFMSNMSPQSASFNRGIWRKIEKQFRDWSYEYGELVIVTGPILNGDYLGSIGPNKVTIPKWYYKVAIDPSNYDRNVAILIKNIGSSESVISFVVTIDYLEEISGLDFFNSLPDEVEASFESSTHTNLWDWNVTYVPKPKTNSVIDGQVGYPKDHLPTNGEVFRTTTGKKYHLGSCRYLSKSKIPITLKEAQESGLGPCGVCKP